MKVKMAVVDKRLKRDRNGAEVKLGDWIRYVGVNEGTKGKVVAFGGRGHKTFTAVTESGATFYANAEFVEKTCEPHDCMEFAVPYESDGPLGHGFECGKCGAFLQAG